MTELKLENVDPEDIEDLLVKVELSFGIRFVGNEFSNCLTFGQLCDRIATKIELDHCDDCTTQQAFYKLRDALSSTLRMDSKSISPDTVLTDILPKQNRRLHIQQIENHLGFHMALLRPPHWITDTLTIILLVSFGGMFIYWPIGVSGLAFSIAGLWLARTTGSKLDLHSVGQVARKMVRENYLQSRRKPGTVNKTEIEAILTDWFSHDLDLEKNELTRDAKFG